MTFWTAAPQNSDDSDPLPQYKSDRWGLPIILILGLTMATISWQKWADLIVDYGTQLYIPWLVSEGKVLYRDVDYLFGPFSAYFHALLFKIFDPGIMVLVWFNLSVVVALGCLIYMLFKYFADSLTANLTTLAFFGIFAFGQYKGGGNFNFICAYSYDLVHGVFLSFFILWLFTQILERPSRFKLFLIGLLIGLVYLTKPEAFLAIATAMVLGFYFLFKKQSLPRNSLLLLLGSFLILPVLTTIYFSFQVPLSQALTYIFLPWFHVFGSPLSDLPMYHWVMGTDFLGENIWQMFFYFFLTTGICLGLILVDRWLGSFSKKSHLAGWGLSILIASSLWYWYDWVPFFDLPRSFPLIVLVFSIVLFIKILKPVNEESNRSLGLWVFSIFSLVLMFKMIFHVQIAHYGFALALPATLVLIHILTHEIPKRLFQTSIPQNIYRPVAITLVTIFIGLHIQYEYKMYSLKGQLVGNGSDTLMDYHSFLNPRGIMFNNAIEFIEKEIPEEAQVTAIPGPILLNFMIRRESSLKYIYLDPGALRIFGDYRIYQDLQTSPPPYIVFVEQKFKEQGGANFGRDFGNHIFQWIHKNYFIIQQYGAQPFVTEDFGIQILKRKPSPNR